MWPGRKLLGVQMLLSVLIPIVDGGVHAKDLRTMADVLGAIVTCFILQAGVPISYRMPNPKRAPIQPHALRDAGAKIHRVDPLSIDEQKDGKMAQIVP